MGIEDANLKELISRLHKDELIDIILNISEDYQEIEKRILFLYTANEDEISNSKKLIREYIRKSKSRGFIEYRNVFQALVGANLTLEKVHKKIENGDTERSIQLSLTVLSIVVDMLQYCDDSSGSVGDVIHESLELISEAVSTGINKLNVSQQTKLFNTLLKEAFHKRYEGWTEWRDCLLKECIYFTANKNLREKLEGQFDKLLKSVPDTSWNPKYKTESIKLLQLKLIEYNDGPEKGVQFINENVQYSSFRKKAIVRLLEEKEYQEVVRLCEEGENVDKEYRGLVSNWKEFKFQAYEALGNIEGQKILALEFLYQDEDRYYPILKRLYQPEEWEITFSKIIKTFEKQSYPPSAYINILIEEKLNEKLLDYCRSHPYSVEQLYPYLIGDYFEEVNLLFFRYIETLAEEARDRKKYKVVCRHIKTYEKVCGSDHALQLVSNLKEKYVRRPALIDELTKLKWVEKK